jgi:glycosyltransferase involved in cell wall biosynthesis
MERLRIGLAGLDSRDLVSVNRTKAFYRRALSEAFEVVPAPEQGPLPAADALLNFRGDRLWRLEPHPPAPVLQCLHGGAVLNTAALRERAGRSWACDVLIGNCSADGAIAAGVGGLDFCRLPLPVAPGLSPAPGLEAELRAGLDVLLGFVGRLMPQKNAHQALRFAADLQRALPQRRVGVIAVGDYHTDYPVLAYAPGAYPDYLPGLARHLGLPLRHLGWVTDAELAAVYAACDLLIHPTHAVDENFGYAPVEAMAQGTPVVGCAYGGLKDTVAHGVTGYLMPTWATPGGLRMDRRPAVAWAAALCEDPRRLAAAGEAARAHAASAFSEPRCAAVLVDAVRRAVARYRAEGPRPAGARPREAPDFGDCLPPLGRPWASYSEGVAAYVSGPPPVPGPRTSLAPYGPLHEGVLQDPTWPARYDLEPLSRALVALGEVTPEAAAAALGESLEEVLERAGELVRRGVLVCSTSPS